jgi:RNA polymerase sigma-70 factor (ECF subfamily)
MDVERGPLSDGDLVVRTLAGERELFGQLYNRYARMVRAVTYGASSDLSTVHDLTQEVFLRAFRQLATLRDQDSFGRWIVGIARQVLREHYRKRPWRFLGNGDEPAVNGTNRPVDDSDEIEHVHRLLGRLPEQERLAVQLFFLNERDVNETGRLLNLSRSGTYALLQRACAKLARWMGVRPLRREETT